MATIIIRASIPDAAFYDQFGKDPKRLTSALSDALTETFDDLLILGCTVLGGSK